MTMNRDDYDAAAARIWLEWGNRLEGWTKLFELARAHKLGRSDWPFSERELAAGLYDEAHSSLELMLERFRLLLPLIERDGPARPTDDLPLFGLFAVFSYKLRALLGRDEQVRAATLLRRWIAAAMPEGEAFFHSPEIDEVCGENWESLASSQHTVDYFVAVKVVRALEQISS